MYEFMENIPAPLMWRDYEEEEESCCNFENVEMNSLICASPLKISAVILFSLIKLAEWNQPCECYLIKPLFE